MSEAEIVRLRWWHIERLLQIEVELFDSEAWTAAMFWSELAAGNYYRLAVDGADILGYAGLAVNGEEAWVNNIAVRGAAQRRGIGSALLTDLIGEARRRGATRVALEVAVDNAPAQRMYDAFGFEGVAVRRGYYQPSNTDALVMLKDLTDE
ncbi:MAG TPA: ribosomal protein S18-alanine N-acetyltransferase [Stackebrandtia sp.]|uniref:ribosomal protein S18-alanine N-acetyltransferase n=1 Tax=Stackebrandtia sp. TaxID=2023065 RepID=UPI002D4F2DCF|nr:ribosomal protein S18-alanine N-acetyltransferase [Stackebrandtia sp.]HZE41045.1 ribosomal protein S18-alanine N-acetyltransferase [Stackebrandtia sp.]